MKDKLYKAILRGKLHLFTLKSLRRFKKVAENAGTNLEKQIELRKKEGTDAD